MFEVAEIGRRLSKKKFKALEPELHTKLLQTQFRLAKSGNSVIIIISGVEGAGKGEVVNRLNEWLDTRGIQTSAFWEETDEQTMRPHYWRFWRVLPARGSIGIMFGSWYTRPIVDRVFGNIDNAEFVKQLDNITEFERMLTNDGVIIIKLWFHMSKDEVVKRLSQDAKKRKVPPVTEKYLKQFEAFLPVCEHTLRHTEQAGLPWHIIEAGNKNYRDISAGEIILESIQLQLDDYQGEERRHSDESVSVEDYLGGMPTILDRIDPDVSLTSKEYNEQLQHQQSRLNKLSWKTHKKRKSVVAVFEGWDAAGKGSAIRRVTRAIDARLYKVLSIAAPTDEEMAHHYLWRFWRHIPLAGYISIYDRSWYGRVLVERVEKFAREEEWKRAYAEINHFEAQLLEHGIVVVKCWLHISKDEQMDRFKAREEIPWKQHKITDEDWRNRERWDDYKHAVNDMVAHTSTELAPWTVIPANDKKYARVMVAKTIADAIEKGLQ